MTKRARRGWTRFTALSLQSIHMSVRQFEVPLLIYGRSAVQAVLRVCESSVQVATRLPLDTLAWVGGDRAVKSCALVLSAGEVLVDQLILRKGLRYPSAADEWPPVWETAAAQGEGVLAPSATACPAPFTPAPFTQPAAGTSAASTSPTTCPPAMSETSASLPDFISSGPHPPRLQSSDSQGLNYNSAAEETRPDHDTTPSFTCCAPETQPADATTDTSTPRTTGPPGILEASASLADFPSSGACHPASPLQEFDRQVACNGGPCDPPSVLDVDSLDAKCTLSNQDALTYEIEASRSDAQYSSSDEVTCTSSDKEAHKDYQEVFYPDASGHYYEKRSDTEWQGGASSSMRMMQYWDGASDNMELCLRKQMRAPAWVVDEESHAHWVACARFELDTLLVLAEAGVPHVLKGYEMFVMPDRTIHLMLELLKGQNMGRWIDVIDSRHISLTWEEKRCSMSHVVSALAGCHAECVFHGDFKPHNMHVSEGPDRQGTLIDFGSAALMDGDEGFVRHEDCERGSLAFMAPEVLTVRLFMVHGLGECPPPLRGGPADCWALGSSLYQFVTGILPVSTMGISLDEGPDDVSCPPPAERRVASEHAAWADTATAVKAATFKELMADVTKASEQDIEAAADLILGLLHPDPALRTTAAQALCHPLLTGL